MKRGRLRRRWYSTGAATRISKRATVCRVRPIWLPWHPIANRRALPHSLYIDRNDLDTEHRRLIELGGDLRHAQELITRTETELASAMAAATAATQRALQMAQANAESVRQINVLRGELALVQRESDRVQGSLRTFMRIYLPRLRDHLLRRRR